MKKIGLIIVALVCLAAWAAAQQAPVYQPAQREIKKYFPGDFVHLMVDAPPDTAKITAIMPNGDLIELVHDRRIGIWTGLWQVPISFKPGTYAADLQASDIEGNKYAGLTSPFIIGELTMVTMIQKQVTPETRAQQGERMSRETALLAIQPEAPAAPQPTTTELTTTTTLPPPAVTKPKPKPVVPRPVAPPVVTPRTLPPEVTPVVVARKKPAPAARKKVARAVQKKQIKFVAVENSKELNLTKARLVTTARYYMEKMDFAEVQGQLNTLVKIDPQNKEYRKMLQRVNKVIAAEKRRSP